MVFDNQIFNKELSALLESNEYKQFYENRDSDELLQYKDIDWKTKSAFDLVKLAQPRGSEVGGITSDEIFFFAKIGMAQVPKTIVEIGTMYGTSTRVWAAVAQISNGQVYAIEGDTSVLPYTKSSIKTIGLESYVTFIEAYSPWIPVLPTWGEIDLLFIDGDHSFISVLVDYHYFNYFVKKGGIIIFHDTNIIEVTEAISAICKRDLLNKIGEVGRAVAYIKVSESQEKYFQIIKREI